MQENQRPRVLVLAGKVAGSTPGIEALCEHYQVDVFENLEQALTALRSEDYHAIFADVGDFLPLERGLVGQQSSLVLNTIGEGVCVIDADGTCRWSNNRMRSFSPQVFEKVKHICCQARTAFARQLQHEPDRTTPVSRKYAFQAEGDRYFELITSPVISSAGEGVRQVVAVVWDATTGKRLQQKIDAIDAAGRELTQLDSELVTGMSPGERLMLLQDKIIRFTKDLMLFDHFAVRVLDRRENKLEIVIAEGLPPEAVEIDLYAQPEGNGISGYVAATGRSYICHDTEKDPRYVMGIEHAKSSLTVPLRLHDEVIGVFNIESEQVGSFNEDDRQFAEIFGRYVALALHILDLLVVERFTTSGRLADHVVQDMAQPLNDVITEAQTLMEEYIGDDAMRARLHRIVDNVKEIRSTLNNVAAGTKAVLGSDPEEDKFADAIIHGKHILVADDEESIRNTLSGILGKRGAQCVVCKDGYEAISRLEQQHFDLVISDIKMPHRNGYEIFAAARRQNEQLPVLLMTGFGYDPNHSIVRASQEGLSSVLFKPFKVEQLIEEVHKALIPEQPAPEVEPKKT